MIKRKKIYWQTVDYQRGLHLSLLQQIKTNFARHLWWKPLRCLANAGFIGAKEGCVVRLRDFTCFFWKTLFERERLRCKREIESLTCNIDQRIREAEIKAVNEFCEKLVKSSKHD